MDPFINTDQQVTTTQLVNAIEVAFCQYAFKIINSNTNGAILHRNVLLKFKELWKGMYSNSGCLACFTANPENTLKCHHAICEPCTVAHGTVCNGEPSAYWVEDCPLCEEPNQTKFYLKPSTAGIRAIISEGGGIRGIIPLAFLKEIEMAIRLPMDIREHFDIAFGSSSGRCVRGLVDK